MGILWICATLGLFRSIMGVVCTYPVTKHLYRFAPRCHTLPCFSDSPAVQRHDTATTRARTSVTFHQLSGSRPWHLKHRQTMLARKGQFQLPPVI